MVATDKLFAGSIPELYERYLAPMIFAPHAPELAALIAQAQPRDVLETAAGTGVLTRALAAQLAPEAHLVVTDLNQPMLDRAAGQIADARIVWQQADALALPFANGSFDAVACQFGAMFFPDKVKGYKEARRVLRPGGRFVFNVWDRIEESEFEDVVTEALARVFPQDPPRFFARIPHGYHDVGLIRAELEAAGFADIAIASVVKTSPAVSARDAAIGLCQGTPLRNEIEARDAARLDEATQAATEALAARFGEGAIEGRTRAILVSAG